METLEIDFSYICLLDVAEVNFFYRVSFLDSGFQILVSGSGLQFLNSKFLC